MNAEQRKPAVHLHINRLGPRVSFRLLSPTSISSVDYSYITGIQT